MSETPVRTELEDLFAQEVEDIRRNPLLAGNWGHYQDYLREHFAYAKTHSVHYEHLPNNPNAVVEVSLYATGGKAYIRLRVPKVGAVQPPPSKYMETELDVLTRPLPDDLQELLMKPTATAVQQESD